MGADAGAGVGGWDTEAVVSVVDCVIICSAGGWTGISGAGGGIDGCDGGAGSSFGFARDFRGFGGWGSFGVAVAFLASFASLAFARRSNSTWRCSAEIVI